MISLLALLSSWVSVAAQEDWTLDENQYTMETIFWCDLVPTVESPTFHATDYEVAAFIDGELRGLADMSFAANMGFFAIRVMGDKKDMGKEITFKARHRDFRAIYKLALREEPLQVYFDGETQEPGTPSNLRHLYLTEVTNISFPEAITIPMNKPTDMLQYLTVEPAGVELPENLEWSVGGQLSEDYFSFEGTTLTGLKPTNELMVACYAGNLYAYTTVTVEEVRVNLALTAENLVCGKPGILILTPTPADAELDVSKITLRADNQFYMWEQPLGAITKKDGHFEVPYTPKAPGPTIIQVTYEYGQFGDIVDVGYPLTLREGWQWYSCSYGNITSDQMETAFGGEKLIEIRSQSELLYNDAQYGYFGPLKESGIREGNCYKIKMKAAWDEYVIKGYPAEGLSPTLNVGWTWIANPYFYRRTLDHMQLTYPEEGDRIVSKEGGFAEFDGKKWVGTLKMFEPNEGYMYYTENENQSIFFMPESYMNGDDDAEPEAPYRARRFARGLDAHPWHYDASLFRDNMSVVATVEGVKPDSRYTVGAYVGDECRGEGVFDDGHIFIVVHGQMGEKVHFYLHDSETGKTHRLNETLAFQPAWGQLKQPMWFSVGGLSTGIGNSYFQIEDADQMYDLQGRRLTTKPIHGMYIQNGKKYWVK